MPNWCYNHASIRHDNPEKIKELQAAAEEGKLFETFVPIGEWDYGTAIEAWGTKWEANQTFIGGVGDKNEYIDLSFDTAWSPPIAFYDALTEQGFGIDATYTEEGMGFAGHYLNGEDECVDLNFDAEDGEWINDIEDEILRDIVQEQYESWQEWQQSEEEWDEVEEEAVVLEEDKE